jgi:outer membrane protein TolC
MNTRMNLLAANLQVYADQLNVIEIEKRQLQSTVVLVKATGGGWSANKLSAIR